NEASLMVIAVLERTEMERLHHQALDWITAYVFGEGEKVLLDPRVGGAKITEDPVTEDINCRRRRMRETETRVVGIDCPRLHLDVSALGVGTQLTEKVRLRCVRGD